MVDISYFKWQISYSGARAQEAWEVCPPSRCRMRTYRSAKLPKPPALTSAAAVCKGYPDLVIDIDLAWCTMVGLGRYLIQGKNYQ